MKHSIYSTSTAKMTVTKTELTALTEFLITNRSRITLPSDVSKRLLASRSASGTPISKIVARAVELGKDSTISLLAIPQSITGYPEIITHEHMTFDVAQLRPVEEGLYKALQVTEFNNKILLNITPYLMRVKSDEYEISDLPAFQAIAVREMLSRSYFMSDRIWIAPAIARFLCRVYSMSLSVAVAAAYNLTIFEQRSVATIFAYYFATQVSSVNEAEDFIKSNASYFYLGEIQEIADCIALIKEAQGNNPLTLEHACQAISNLGIQRMKLSRRILHERAKSWGPNLYTSIMALEYAPYWAYILLLAASGRKIGITFNLKKNSDIWRQLVPQCEELLKAPGFLPLL